MAIWKGYRSEYAVLEARMGAWLVDFGRRYVCRWTPSSWASSDCVRLAFETLDFDEVRRLQTESDEILGILSAPVKAEPHVTAPTSILIGSRVLYRAAQDADQRPRKGFALFMSAPP